ncbi:MAG: hypothetical protein QOI57_1603 [Rubrobacteraceae bacterium]|nr:hypothetical protein [Rubrobacteraceae bacterium]
MIEVIDRGSRSHQPAQKASVIATDMRLQPEFAAAVASTHGKWLSENWLERASRKACHLVYTASDHSRCISR